MNQDRRTGRHPARVDARGRRLPGSRGLLALPPLLALLLTATATAGPRREAPPRLADTGLYADPGAGLLAPGVRTWSPQYPLWSDGASKRRWILLPAGRAIDASDPDGWVFPVGTRLWKEFSFGGRRVETRYMERRSDGSWIYATYRWAEDGSGAVLAPATGVRAVVALAPGAAHDLPSTADCEACHAAGKTPVLGFSALQLSPDRDPLAPHAEPVPEGAIDLPTAVGLGMVKRLPAALRASPPRVRASTPVGRAALGYLHGNCSSCHDVRGELASVGLDFVQRVAPGAETGPETTAIEVPSRYQAPGSLERMLRIAPGAPDRSAVVHRLSSRDPSAQMPPIGTHLVDAAGVELVRAWISGLGRSTPSSPLVER